MLILGCVLEPIASLLLSGAWEDCLANLSTLIDPSQYHVDRLSIKNDEIRWRLGRVRSYVVTGRPRA